VQQLATAQRLVDELAPSKHGDLTSTRPALVAYTVSLMGHAAVGSADDMLGQTMARMLDKLELESVRDTATTLMSLERP
jgi:hypothetical protein